MAATSFPIDRVSTLPLPDIYARVSRHVPAIEWPALADDVAAILELKKTRNAVILAHNYQAPEIFHTVSDIVGDSLALAREAINVDADVIVLAGVHFMAETAKLLNPGKTVLIPDMRAGCSLADSITAADVRGLREKYPGVPIVTYVNTSAAVKAESDVCCTSGNAVDVVRSLNAPRVLMIPDEFLAQNVQVLVPEVEILTWARPLRGPRAVHPRRYRRGARELSRRHRHRPSGMPARRGGGIGLLGFDRDDDELRHREAAASGGARDRMLHGRQHRRREPGHRVHQALQPVPAHEADVAPEHPPRPGDPHA